MLNTINCPSLKEFLDLLNISEIEFSKLYIFNQTNLADLYFKQTPGINSLEQLIENQINSFVFKPSENNELTTERKMQIVNWIDNALKTLIAYNSNINFELTDNCPESKLIIEPGLDINSAPSALLHYENQNNILTQTINRFIIPILHNNWNSAMHSIAHIFEDHYNENGLYQTNENELSLYKEKFEFGSALDYSSKMIFQSLLPHDIEVLNR